MLETFSFPCSSGAWLFGCNAGGGRLGFFRFCCVSGVCSMDIVHASDNIVVSPFDFKQRANGNQIGSKLLIRTKLFTCSPFDHVPINNHGSTDTFTTRLPSGRKRCCRN